jgi:hypothetical protein
VPYKQVAVYENNTVKTNQFHLIVNRICSYYSATTVGENNSIGMEVLNNLNYDTEYGKIFYDSGRFGLRMTQKTKRSGNAKLKEMIDTNKLILSDFKTIFQFSTYIEKGSTFKADDNKHDDLVTPFVLFAYFMNNSEWTSDWLDQYDVYTKLNLEFIKRIEDNILPFYYNNGHEEFELK